MQYYKCQCGHRQMWGSGMYPAPCDGCVICNTTMAGGPSGHLAPVDHEWEQELVETDDGYTNGMTYCRRCYGKKRDLVGPGLGLDFGNVIKVVGEYHTIDGAEEGVKELKKLFRNRIWLISRVDDDAAEERTRGFIYESWRGFKDNIQSSYFTRLREEKAPIAERLGVTYFVDDRTEVLSHMKSVKHRIALNPTEEQLRDFPPSGMVVVKTWPEVVDYIKGTFNAAS